MSATAARIRRAGTVLHLPRGLRHGLAGLAVAAALTCPRGPALAQGTQVGDLAPGARVRVQGPALASPIVGRVTSIRNDTLAVLPDGATSPTTISLEKPIEVQVSQGKPLWPWIWKGVLAGGVAGFVVGTLIGNQGTVGTSHIGRDIGVGTAIGVASGAALGAATGAFLAPERWKTVFISYQKTPSGPGSLDVGFRLPM